MQWIKAHLNVVITVAIASKRELRETTKIVDDQIKKNIESIDGVGQVRFIGERTRQIQVWLDGQKTYAYNLNVDQVRSALAAQNVEVPGGRVDQGARELSLRTLGRLERPADGAVLEEHRVIGACESRGFFPYLPGALDGRLFRLHTVTGQLS
jgi:HAE1 family hydrophobic/amphiphilic exporter-1